MCQHLSVIIGPARCGKTRFLLGQYREALLTEMAAGAVGRVLWLAPTSRAAAAVVRQLLDSAEDIRPLRACLEPGVITFARLADRLLSNSPQSPRTLSPPMERALVRRAIRAACERKSLAVLAAAARRSSFVDLVVEHFRELKRRGIDAVAFGKAIGTRGDRNQHEELSRLYADYEQLLEVQRLADRESRHWEAQRKLSSDESTSRGPWKLVVADGFADFTHSQQGILRQLARRAERVLISLPGDAVDSLSLPAGEERSEPASTARRGGRDDLFAKSSATLAELQRCYPALRVERLARRRSAWPAIDHLEQNVFRHPRETDEPSSEAIASLDRLEIVPAAGVQNEIVALARRVKRRLIDGARPDDLVVVFRQLRDAAPRVREVFTEFGIPYSLEAGLPLVTAGLVRTMLSLLRLGAEDWPFRRVVSVVTNNLLTDIDRPARRATEWLVRDLQIASGRRELLDRVMRLAAPALAEPVAPEADPDGSPSERRRAAAVAALPVLNQLAAALDELPKSATPTEWLAALERLGQRLGIEPFTAPSSADEVAGEIAGDLRSPDGVLAWQILKAHFADVERLADWLGEPPPQLSRDDLLDLLIDVATHESLPRPADDVGRVRVLSAATARTIEAKHLLLAGMSEQAFPTPERQGLLYTEADYRAFANVAEQSRAELPTVTQPQEEMLLFYEVLTRATERLTISYPALDERAQALPPSPYIDELKRIAGSERLGSRAVPRPSPLPADAIPCGPADWRVLAVHQALERDDALLAGLFGDSSLTGAAASLDAAVRIIAARAHRDKFGPAEGLLTGDTVRTRLARRFGLQHLWSPSQWERYAVCPYRYFLEDVLGLEPLGDLTLETDHRLRGTRLHRVMAEFHRRLATLLADGQTPSQQELATFEDQFKSAADEVMRHAPRSGVEAALAEIDRRQIDKWGQSYFQQHANYDAAWSALDEPPVPKHFEFRFGPPQSTGDGSDDEADDAKSTSLPFVLDIGREQIRVTGRIDRIDVGHAGGRLVFNVVDYKTGRRPTLTAEKIESGERLQPALYVMAAQALLFGDDEATPLWAGYWSMKQGVTTKKKFSLLCSVDGQQTTDEWETLQGKVSQRVAQFVTDIRCGDFPVVSRDDDCTSHCPYCTVCRVAQVRSLGKQWLPEEEND